MGAEVDKMGTYILETDNLGVYMGNRQFRCRTIRSRQFGYKNLEVDNLGTLIYRLTI